VASHQFDLVVVGAGPAGTAAARDAARHGARVAIVDGSHPREKACGGGVTGRALKVAGALAAQVPATLLRTAVFEADGRSARVPMDGDEPLRVVARAEFDAALLAEATASGAVHVRARAMRLDRDHRSWHVITNGADALRAPWIVAADGPCGISRKQLCKPFDRSQLSIAAGSFVDDVASDEVRVAFVDDPTGYFWSFPRTDHLAAGACAQADASTAAALHAVTDRWLDRYPPAAGKPRRRYSWPIPSLSVRDLDTEIVSGDGWMLTGDAAGLVDPITREGIYFALRSGQLAADALGGTDPARIYAAAVRDELCAELRRAARLKAAVFEPRFTRLLVEALERSASIRRVMIDLIAGRQSYKRLKRRLLATLEIGLMWSLFISRGTRPGLSR
jgi:geranylgeranyl reductase family protein